MMSSHWRLRVFPVALNPMPSLAGHRFPCGIQVDVPSIWPPCWMSSPIYLHWMSPTFSPIFPLSSTTLGKLECIEEVMRLESKDMLALQRGPYLTYGTCSHSLNLMSETWHGLKHVFSIHGPHPLSSSSAVQGQYHYMGP